MTMRNIYKSGIFFCCFLFSFFGNAQQTNSQYFIENSPTRNYLNPSFQFTGSFYFGLPVLGNMMMDAGNNSVTLKDLIYKQNNQTIFFYNPTGNKLNFYNALAPTTILNTDFQLNLIDFGFKTGNSCWNFSVTEKLNGYASIPQDLMKLALFGTPDLNSNYFNLKNTGIDLSLYTEAGLGYSRKINDRLTIGGKLKFLYGTANVSDKNENIDVNASVNQWTINGKGNLNTAGPVLVQIGNHFESLSFIAPTKWTDWLKPSGLGAGMDLGLTFKPVNELTLSAAVTDLGFIHWATNVQNVAYSTNFTFNGFGNINPITNSVDLSKSADSVLILLKNSLTTNKTTVAYTTNTTAKLNVGAEYGFLKNKLSVGVLSRTTKRVDFYSEELTASLNGRPTEWLNMSLSYSFYDGKMSNIGAGIGLRTGVIHWLLSADYIPLNYTTLPLNALNINLPSFTAPIPYTAKKLNFSLGINFVFGYRKDADKDGVVDRLDKCPNTPFGVIVDKKGCPVDTDGDGVPDYLDKCPKTPPAAYSTIDQDGCPKDTDGDGVPDYLDKCPDTSKEARGHVDKKGCPLDTDGDGVPDYLDKCPNTPKAAYGHVDKNGCPIDTDGDGIPDYLDKCPTVPGVISNNGCPEEKKVPLSVTSVVPEVKKVVPAEVKNELKTLFQKALQGIQFASGSDLIIGKSFVILNQIAGVMIANPGFVIEVRGFTDNVGNPLSNKILSERRANAVRKYLVKKGVEISRITTTGFGDTLPLESNKTANGRAINRRVEFIVSYEEIILK